MPQPARSATTPISIPISNSASNGHFSHSAYPHSSSYSSITISPTSASNYPGLRPPKVLHPFATGELRLLLLENINHGAVESFKHEGFQVDFHTRAFSEDELVDKIGNYHAIGIRSKTKITERVIKAASKLLAIGCFCIGVNQVDLPAAASAGIPVFNSPFSNSRSVAELVMAEIVGLSRQLHERTREMREGVWNKVSKGCWEIRGKTLGIIGYGHIGTQLSVLAEAFGMRVIYYDVVPIMPLGRAMQFDALDDLLAESDFVTLHVPELPETKNMISAVQLSKFKKGSYLINNSRGSVVDIPALVDALKSKHLAGCALDVYPVEPGSNGSSFSDKLNPWSSVLRSIPNVILTPHIGGSTEEAQRMIGVEVASSLIRYLHYGSTTSAVNFPEVDLRAITADQTNFIRVCHVHINQPGVLRQVNEILSDHNVEKQYSDSKGPIAYLMADISEVSESDVQDIYERISKTRSNILTRLLT